MKQAIIVVVAIFGTAMAGLLPSTYLPPTVGGGSAHGAGAGAGAGAYHGGQGSAAGAYHGGQGQGAAGHYQGGSSNNHAEILRLENEINPDGSYKYAYETSDGTQADEAGHLNGESVEAHGSFSFVAPDGVKYDIHYTAGEGGFQPQGAHIPTPPPVPEEILKGLEQNAAEEAKGIFDDGQYRPDPSEGSAHGQGYAHGAGAGANAGSAAHGGYKY